MERALRCPASTIWPEVDPRSEKLKAAGDFGTQAHTWKETGVLAEAWSGAQQARFAALARERYWPSPPGHHEIVLWYDPVTRDAGMEHPGDWLGPLDRFANIPKTACFTIADYVSLEPGWVDDLKTGYQPTPPYQSPQLWLGALVLSLLLSQDSVAMSVTKIARYPMHSMPERLTAHTTAKGLRAFERRVWEAYANFLLAQDRERAGARQETRAGEHCKWCMSKGLCDQWKMEDGLWVEAEAHQ